MGCCGKGGWVGWGVKGRGNETHLDGVGHDELVNYHRPSLSSPVAPRHSLHGTTLARQPFGRAHPVGAELMSAIWLGLSDRKRTRAAYKWHRHTRSQAAAAASEATFLASEASFLASEPSFLVLKTRFLASSKE